MAPSQNGSSSGDQDKPNTLQALVKSQNFQLILAGLQAYMQKWILYDEKTETNDNAEAPMDLSTFIPSSERISSPIQQTLLAKSLFTLDFLTKTAEKQKSHPRFLALVKHLQKYDIIPEHILRSYLDFKLLMSLKMIDKKYHSAWVKYRSQLVFAPERFNLFQEESEGYSKLLLFLLETPLTEDNFTTFVENLESTIGCFSLDPTRVLDILLDIYSMNLDNHLYMDVLKKCGAKGQYHMLMGFKFKQFASLMEESAKKSSEEKPAASSEETAAGEASAENDDDDESSAQVNIPPYTPERLFHLAALLIENEVMSIGQLIPYLAPQNTTHQRTMMKELHGYLKKKMAEAKDLAATSLSGDVLTLESSPYRAELPPLNLPVSYLHNQRLQMIGALLQRNLFSIAFSLMLEYQEMRMYLHPQIQKGLFCVLEKSINKVCPSDSSFFGIPKKRSYSNEDFQVVRLEIYPMLQFLEVGLAAHPSLATKVARLVLDIVESGYRAELGANHSCDDPQNIFFHIVCILYQSRSLMHNSSQFSCLFWKIIKTLKYQDRFAVYENILQGHNDNFLLRQHASLVSKRTNDIIKKLTKDNARTKSRYLVQFIHSNPLIVCDKIVSQAQVYENLIEPMSELVRWFHSLTFDEMTYVILKRLQPDGYKPRVKSDDTTVQNWVSNVGTLSGKLLRKYSYSGKQFYPIIKFILAKFKEGSWEDSILLTEILKEVVNEELVEDISKEQLEASAGGATLQKLAAAFQHSGDTPNEAHNRDAALKMVRNLSNNEIGSELLLLLAKFSANSTYMFDYETSLTLVRSCKESTHSAFVSLLRFMARMYKFEFADGEDNTNSQAPPSQSSDGTTIKIPSLSFLRNCQIPPAHSFALCRPVVRENLSSTWDQIPAYTAFVKAEQLEEDEDKMTDENEGTDEHVNQIWNVMSKKLYTLFWILDAHDIYYPEAMYTQKIATLQEEEKSLKEKKSKKLLADDKKKKLHAKIQSVAENIQSLKTEQQAHKERHEAVLTFIKDNAAEICESSSSSPEEFMQHFFQWCIYPRCHFSIIDTLYCTKFVQALASCEKATFTFNVVEYMRTVLDQAPIWLCFDTDQEAIRIGALVEASLDLSNSLLSTKQEKSRLADEVRNNSSFFLRKGDESFDGEEYANNAHHHLHTLLTGRIGSLLEKTGSVHYQRNALLVLNRISDQYPKYRDHADALRKNMSELSKRKDMSSILPIVQRYEDKLKRLSSSLLTHGVKKTAQKKNVSPPVESTPAAESKTTKATSEAKPSSSDKAESKTQNRKNGRSAEKDEKVSEAKSVDKPATAKKDSGDVFEQRSFRKKNPKNTAETSEKPPSASRNDTARKIEKAPPARNPSPSSKSSAREETKKKDSTPRNDVQKSPQSPRKERQRSTDSGSVRSGQRHGQYRSGSRGLDDRREDRRPRGGNYHRSFNGGRNYHGDQHHRNYDRREGNYGGQKRPRENDYHHRGGRGGYHNKRGRRS